MIKVGDIIDGKRVTKVFELCGGLAYQTEPAGAVKEEKAVFPINEPEPIEPEKAVEPEKPKRGRKRKEA